MLLLPLDAKYHIAQYDQEVWFFFYLHDEQFKTLISTPYYINIFINLFTVKIKDYYSIKYKLFGKLHRINDKPAVIYYNGTKVWYINGKRHRDNDQPAAIFATN